MPQSGLAGSFPEGLAAQDFDRLAGTLAADARLRALLPAGPFEWTGAEVIAGRFAGWFGDTEDFELLEADVGEVGGRLYLHWRLRLRAQRLGTGWFTVEQQAYADTDDGGRIARLDLLCTGYLPERGRARSAGAGKAEWGRARSAGAGKAERGRARSAGAGKAERGRARSAGAGKAESDDD